MIQLVCKYQTTRTTIYVYQNNISLQHALQFNGFYGKHLVKAIPFLPISMILDTIHWWIPTQLKWCSFSNAL